MRERAEGSGAADLKRYRVFGITLASDFPFETPLRGAVGPVELTFVCDRAAPSGRPFDPGGEPAFRSRHRLPSGRPLLEIHRGSAYDLIRYNEVVDFRVGDDRIHAHLIDPAYDFMVEIHLLGLVFSYWFERRGIPMLHASAVAVEDRAAVFVATNRGGKSSLACALMRAGHPLLSDDIVGLQLSGATAEARPGFPSMRLWPDQAEHFRGSWEGLDLAHPREEKRRMPVGGAEGFGSFRDDPARIGAFYLPERRDPGSDEAGDPPSSRSGAAREGDQEIRFEPVSPGEAVIELVRGSFLPRLTEEAGFARERMALFGRVASEVPMKRLVYPDGNEHLPRVARAIVADIRSGACPEGRTP